MVSSVVGVPSRGGPKPTSECCVSLTWMVMQGEHTGVYPGSGNRRPYIQRGGEFCISLHRGACVGVTSLRERAASPSLKERKKSTERIAWDVDLCVGSLGLLVFGFELVSCLLSVSPCRVLTCPFIGQEEARAPGSLEVMFLSIPVGVTVATCSRNGQPSLDTVVTLGMRRRNDPEHRATPAFLPCRTALGVEAGSRLGRCRTDKAESPRSRNTGLVVSSLEGD
jgi:hypothetical protein